MNDKVTIPLEWWMRGWRFGRYGLEEPLPQTCEAVAEWLAGYKAGKAGADMAGRGDRPEPQATIL